MMDLRWWIFPFLLLSVQIFGQEHDAARLKALASKLQRQYESAKSRMDAFARGKTNPVAITTMRGQDILVVDILPDGTPVYRITLNEGAAVTTGAMSLHNAGSGLLLDGSGITVSVWDGGLVKDHIEFGDRLVGKEGLLLSDHATHVSGTIAASGVNPTARGMAPNVKISTHFFSNDLAVMAALAADKSVLISNHSYGSATGWMRVGADWSWVGNATISAEEDARFGFYGDRAEILDDIAYHAPTLAMFWAVGNDRSDAGNGTKPRDCNAGTGYDCILPDAVAKNVFTIGAVGKVLGYSSPSSVVMGTYSSWGPTDDGRIKPDFVAAGSDLLSLSGHGTNTYEVMSGTSMATPGASGSMALIQQLYAKLHGGRYMRSATMKALAVHTTKEAGSFPGPDYSFGWGLLDVQAAAQTLLMENGTTSRVSELTLTEGGTIKVLLLPEANKKVTATIAWTDPPAAPLPASLDPSNPMLVNDLDIRLVDDTGVEQFPWTLDPINPSRQAVRGDNFRDNVEKIEFLNPQSKPYQLIVSHKGKLKNNLQQFSLVLSYQPATLARTLFWIGGTGSWSDAQHWSTKSGGITAGIVPNATDQVIFDEASFAGASNAVVTVPDAVACARLTWISSSDAEIDLNSKSLTVSGSLRLDAVEPVFRNGTVRLSGTGDVQWSSNAIHDADFVFETGSWEWYGNAKLRSLEITGGTVNWHAEQLTTGKLLSKGSAPRALNFGAAVVNLTASSEIDGQGLSLISDNTRLVASADVILSWNAVTWNGSVETGSYELELTGNNNIGQLQIGGSCSLSGNNTLGLLQLSSGGSLSLANNSVQHIDSILLQSEVALPASIVSTGSASLNLKKRHKYCFDHLVIRSVSLQGMAVVNTGNSSTLDNAINWATGSCTDVLFSDFEIAFACEGGLASLKGGDDGNPQNWAWQITGPAGAVSALSGREVEFALGAAGDYTVSLSVSRGTSANSFSRSVQVSGNPIGTVEIAAGSTNLVSTINADHFQWFVNGVKVTGASGRSYRYLGAEGVYSVVAYSGACSSISKPLVVTGVEEASGSLTIFPNPAIDRLFIAADKPVVRIRMLNTLGQQVPVDLNDGIVSTSHLEVGVYFIEVDVAGKIHRQKVVITR